MAHLQSAKTHQRVSGWSTVFRVLKDEGTRSRVITALRASGFTTVDVAHHKTARLALAEILTRTEDWLEISKPKAWLEREAIRTVRRRLEVEVLA